MDESPGLVSRDKSTVSRENRPNRWYSSVVLRMWCYYRAAVAHDKSRRRAQRYSHAPLMAVPRRGDKVCSGSVEYSAPVPSSRVRPAMVAPSKRS